MESALARFSERWHSGYHEMVVVRPESLDMVEAELHIKLPLDYREQVLAVGLPNIGLDLLSAIVDRGPVLSHLPDLSAFADPPTIITETEDWREIGMPAQLVVIAWDSMGNKFCFSTGDMLTRRETATIWFWDHDFNETTKLADSFTKWLDLYVTLGQPSLLRRIFGKG